MASMAVSCFLSQISGCNAVSQLISDLPNSLHSLWIVMKSVQGPCTARLEPIDCANLARTHGMELALLVCSNANPTATVLASALG